MQSTPSINPPAATILATAIAITTDFPTCTAAGITNPWLPI